tara:strand:- start:465 stop:599 length:135 start_codon:yes stop_codon:yes gene_type:complete
VVVGQEQVVLVLLKEIQVQIQFFQQSHQLVVEVQVVLILLSLLA